MAAEPQIVEVPYVGQGCVVSEILVQVSALEVSVVVRVPLRPDGASGHQLDEIITYTCEAFRQAWAVAGEYTSVDGDDDDTE